MTDDHAGSAPALNDEHERTYKLFLKLVTFTAATVAGILVILAIIAG
jgi:hypothetical protein